MQGFLQSLALVFAQNLIPEVELTSSIVFVEEITFEIILILEIALAFN
jgi:hypothetical protein